MKQILLFCCCALVLGLSSCYYDKESELYPPPPCSTTDVKYSTVVKPIVDANCNSAGCHSGTNPGDGYDFTTYSGLQKAALDGTLLGSLEQRSGYSAMPKNGSKLPDCQINQIRIWVNDGAPNN